ncbi:hypothetical protein WJX72_010639 [[Myrmecia] bisecta]|uniref:acid phosphatase n=1 Tax=[Myrmecia] bisecta TaxID=41462 RepID=A0AAW1P642_9CHLO
MPEAVIPEEQRIYCANPRCGKDLERSPADTAWEYTFAPWSDFCAGCLRKMATGASPATDSIALLQANTTYSSLDQDREPAEDGHRHQTVDALDVDAVDVEGGLLARQKKGGFSRAHSKLILKISAGFVLGLLVGALLVGVPSALRQHEVKHTAGVPYAIDVTRPKGEPYAKFLVVGDWGRLGQYDQKQVAAMMGAKATQLQPDFIISSGDNFYPSGLTSVDDPAFDTSFSKVYTAASLQVPWYNILGNHDYADGHNQPEIAPPGCKNIMDCYFSPKHQLGNSLVSRDARWHCDRAFHLALAGGKADLFFFDTPPFVTKYRAKAWANVPGGLVEQSWEANLANLTAQLKASQADWKIVIGHHPVRSNGHHNNTDELIQHVEPLLKEYNVAAYIAGHDHSLEHIHRPNAYTHHIISGGGSKSDRPFIDTKNSMFQWQASGFVAVEVRDSSIYIEYLGIKDPDLRPLHTLAIPRGSNEP